MNQNENPTLIPYILENMGDAVCVTNRRGELQFMNPAAEKLFGMSFTPDKPTKIWQAIPYVETNDDLIQLFIQAIHAGENAEHLLVKYENPEGRVSDVRVSLTRSTEDGGRFLIVISDLTELFRVTDAFRRYTSPEIADYVLYTPGGESQGGVAREVSILFADLRGSTALSTVLQADRLVDMLNRFFEKMVEVVARCRGTVIEFLGDCIYAVFGAPEDDPDHADHAVACAIGMQNAILEVNADNRACGDPDLAVGIGIHSGTVVVGNIGSRDKMKYGCVGEAVNLAARLESLTVGGDILISEYTAKKIRGDLEVISRREFLPKGAKTPMQALYVGGLGDNRVLRHEEETVWMVPNPPENVTFHFLDEHKSVNETPFSGKITAVSRDGNHAVLLADSLPPVSADLMIEIDGSLYAKVTGTAPEGAVLTFTTRPGNFGHWFRALLSRASSRQA